MKRLTRAVGLLVVLGLLAVPVIAGDEEVRTKDNLVGAWQTGDGVKLFTYTFTVDGAWKVRIKVGEKIESEGGTWSYEDEVLTLGQEGVSEPLKLSIDFVDKHYIDTWLADSPKMPRIRWVRRVPTAPKEGPLAGTWIANVPDYSWRLELREDGTYRMVEGAEPNAKVTTGTWRQTPASLVMRLDDDPEKEFTWNLRFLDKDHVDLTDEHVNSDDIPWRREGSATPVPAREPQPLPAPTPMTPSAGPKRLVGEWIAKDATMEVRLTLLEDGTFVHVLKTESSKETSRGTWKIEGDTLIGDPEGEDELYRLTWKLIDDDHLSLTDVAENETTVMRRAGAKIDSPNLGALSEEAKSMIGEWLARDGNTEVRISLRSDGTFSQTIRQGEKVEKTEGHFNVRDGNLIAKLKNEYELTGLKIRLIDAKTLQIVDAEGGVTRLVRQ